MITIDYIGEGGRVRKNPKIDYVILEQPLIFLLCLTPSLISLSPRHSTRILGHGESFDDQLFGVYTKVMVMSKRIFIKDTKM